MKPVKYKILTIFDFDEEGSDVSGIVVYINLEEMEKQFADVESMFDYADRCCDEYQEDCNGDEIRYYDDGHNIDSLINFLIDRGLILDYNKEFSFTYRGTIDGDICFRDCDLKLKFY